MEFSHGIVLVEDDQFGVFHPHEKRQFADRGEELCRLEARGGEQEVHCQTHHL